MQRGATTGSRLMQSYGKLPLRFERNEGQSDARVRFLARGAGSTLFFTSSDVVLALHAGSKANRKPHPSLQISAGPRTGASRGAPTNPRKRERAYEEVIRLHLVGASRSAQVVGVRRLPGIVNYFRGNRATRWHADIPTYARVEYRNVLPGVTLAYFGRQGSLEYDLMLRPGVNPGRIHLGVTSAGGRSRTGGASSIAMSPTIDRQGNLMLRSGRVEVRQARPVVYQQVRGTRRSIAARYVVSRAGQIGFQLGAYDRGLALVIDPTVTYSTYLGGSGDDAGNGIAVDGAGNAYVVGSTSSVDFPNLSSAQAATAGPEDVFVAKLNAVGTALLYSTYLGGSADDFGQAIALDSSGNAYVTGYTYSTDFPTVNPIQSKNNGDADVFVAKLNPSGNALAYSTYLGGKGADFGQGIAVDGAGSAYIAGYTYSTDFPTASPLQATNVGNANAFVTKLNAAGSALTYSTYLGGNDYDYATGIAVDSFGSTYVAGYTSSTTFPTCPNVGGTAPCTSAGKPLQGSNAGGVDAFVAKVSASGSGLVYSTYLGGSGDDMGNAIAVDSGGNAYVTGDTYSTDFPTVGPLQSKNAGGDDAFVAKLNAAGTALLYSTYFGGSSSDAAYGIAVDSAGSAYLAGSTLSTDLPTVNPTQGKSAGSFDAFVAKVGPSGASLWFSTYLGGSGDDFGQGIAVDNAGNAYVTGQTASTDLPTVVPEQGARGGGWSDAFIAKISAIGGGPHATLSSAVSTAQYSLTGSDGRSWMDLDPATLSTSVTPSANVTAIVSGNADLWTSSAGYNQDLGIWISGGSYGAGQIVAWKQSSGFAGTVSPNAVFVETVLPLTSGTSYQIKLKWKTNKPDSGTIWAGAGPIGGRFSPTRLTVEQEPRGIPVFTAVTTQQPTLVNSDGTRWKDMDPARLSVTITPPSNTTAILSGSADLWTSVAGYNQDMGINVNGRVAAWKENGGFAGTFSPNAAFVQTVLPMTAGTTYTIKLQWKTNKPTGRGGSKIGAGAGPIGGAFSPTRLTVVLEPSSVSIATGMTTQQPTLVNSDGASWVDMDATNLSLTVSPATDTTAILSGNADLWTSTAGYNQDFGIWISGGSYGAGQIVAWKESSGFVGRLSPNAAFVQTVLSLSANATYIIKLKWKTNKPTGGGGSKIFAGAGPIAGRFSPTRLTVEMSAP